MRIHFAFLFLLVATAGGVSVQLSWINDFSGKLVRSVDLVRLHFSAIATETTTIDLGVPLALIDEIAAPLAWSGDDGNAVVCLGAKNGFRVCSGIPLTPNVAINVYLQFFLRDLQQNTIVPLSMDTLFENSMGLTLSEAPKIQLRLAPIPLISGVAGCTDWFPITTNCPVGGMRELTIFGYGFGPSNAQVTIGDRQVDQVSHVASGTVPGEYQLLVRGYNQHNRTNNDYSLLPVRVNNTYGELSDSKNFVGMKFVPKLQSVAGCTTDVTQKRLLDCDPDGNTPITIFGSNFGLAGSTVQIYFGDGASAITCAKVVKVDSSTVICQQYSCTGADKRIMVSVDGENTTESDIRVTFTPGISISSITGCQPNPNNWRATQLCPIGGTTPLTITGTHFGSGPVSLSFGDSSGTSIPCQYVTHDLSAPETKLVCVGYSVSQANVPLTDLSVTLTLLDRNYRFSESQVTIAYAHSCPTDGSAVCSGHGLCLGQTGQCQCYNSDAQGHWDGPLCADCAAGYWGPQCRYECSGGACTPCSMHGTCSQGISGTGACTCFADSSKGYWGGFDCRDCMEGYFGTQCLQTCPSQNGMICGGHGSCLSGALGSGTCSCFKGWTGDVCDHCLTGHWGPNCAGICPGGERFPCTGHGTCSQGTSGNGQCTCQEGWVGTDCSLPCPMSNGKACGSNGQCLVVPGTLDFPRASTKCQCKSNHATRDCSKSCPVGSNGAVCGGTLVGRCDDGDGGTGQCICNGNAGGPTCEDCATGYFGPACNLRCHGFPSNPVTVIEANTLCSNSGTCNRTTGDCDCFVGYGGKLCENKCPSDSRGRLCGGHGTCSPTMGVCLCGTNWALPTCAQCVTGWYGVDCMRECPGGSTFPCSNRGDCVTVDDAQTIGSCNCHDSTFGSSCQCAVVNIASPDLECRTIQCPSGLYGSACQYACPGGRTTPCYGHGTCDHTKLSDGKCYCADGWAGPSCNIECKGGASKPCNGHGTCNPVDGSCLSCSSGYGGDDCSKSCKGMGNGNNVCNGHGTCDDGVGGSMQCTCSPGYSGSDCSSGCPSNIYGICSGHGKCNDGPNGDGSCRCNNGYSGTACEQCPSGYAGYYCSTPCLGGANRPCNNSGVCNQGVLGDGSCQCNGEWAGPACMSRCPTDAYHRVCGGYGTCNTTTATCQCTGNQYGPACETYCEASATCLGDPKLMCSPINGTCICARSLTSGYWDGPNCQNCADGWWGDGCNRRCDCGHGTCNRLTGDCVCFSSPTEGYWAGRTCAVCQTGYIGLNCDAQSADITRIDNLVVPGGITSALFNFDTGSVVFDDKYHRLYAGGRPLVRFTVNDPSAPQQFMDPGGTVTSGFLAFSYGYFSIFFNSGHDDVICRIDRVAPLPADMSTLSCVTLPCIGCLTNQMAVSTSDGVAVYLVAMHATASTGTAAAADTLAVLQFSDSLFDLTLVSISSDFASAHQVLFNPKDKSCLIVGSDTTGSSLVVRIQLDDLLGSTKGKSASNPVASASIPTLADGGKRKMRPMTTFDDLGVIPRQAQQPEQTITSGDGSVTAIQRMLGSIPECNPIIDAATQTTTVVCTPVLMDIEVINGVSIMFVAMHADLPDTKLIVARVPLNPSDGPVIYERVQQDRFGITAMAVDPISELAFVAVNTDIPSVIYKFRIRDMKLVGTRKCKVLQTSYEVVVQFTINNQDRILYGLTTLVPMSVIQIMLYAVNAVQPAYADMRGGTVITVIGEGFVNHAELQCQFGTSPTPFAGTFVDSNTVLCIAPTSDSSDMGCTGAPLEVAISAERFTSNGVQLQFVSTPVVASISPDRSMTIYPSVVTVHGFGFVPSDFFKCRVAHPQNLTNAVVVSATILDPRTLLCPMPYLSQPSLPGSYLELSVDANWYSNNKIPFDIIGEPTHIEANSTRVSVKADRVSLIPPLAVSAVDSVGHLLKNENFSAIVGAIVEVRLIHLRSGVDRTDLLAVASASTAVFRSSDETSATTTTTSGAAIPSSIMLPVINGSAVLAGMAFVLPTTDDYTLDFTFFTPDDWRKAVESSSSTSQRVRVADHEGTKWIPQTVGGTWTLSIPLTVVQGAPYRAHMKSNPPLRTATDGSIAKDLTVEVTDIAGNLIDPTLAITVRATSEPRYPLLNARQPTINALAQFRGLIIPGRHGLSYNISFSVEEDASVTGEWFVIGQGLCQANQFAYYFDWYSNCRACPKGAVCNGSVVIAAQLGYWRRTPTYALNPTFTPRVGEPRNNESVFYPCLKDTVCRGGVDTGCEEGHTGRLCAECLPDYGEDNFNCLKCPSWFGANVLLVILYVIVVGGIFVLLNLSALADNVLLGRTDVVGSGQYVSVVLKILMGHLQLIAFIGLYNLSWPQAVKDLLWLASMASMVDLRFRVMSCLFGFKFYTRFWGYMVLPFLILGATIIIFAIIYAIKKRLGKRTAVLEKLCTVNVVSMVLLYPTLLRQIGYMFACVDVYGVSYLQQDITMECYTPEHEKWMLAALGFGIFYIVALPFIGLLFLTLTAVKGRLMTRGPHNTIGFLYRGYREKLWWWDTVIHLRRCAIVFIGVYFFNEPKVQAYCAMWIIAAMLLFNVYFVPFQFRYQTRLDNISLVTVFATLNLGLFYDQTENSAGEDFLTFLIFFTNIVVIILYLAFFLRLLKSALLAYLIPDNHNGAGTWTDLFRLLKAKLQHRTANVNVPRAPSTFDQEDEDFDEDYTVPGMPISQPISKKKQAKEVDTDAPTYDPFAQGGMAAYDARKVILPPTALDLGGAGGGGGDRDVVRSAEPFMLEGAVMVEEVGHAEGDNATDAGSEDGVVAVSQQQQNLAATAADLLRQVKPRLGLEVADLHISDGDEDSEDQVLVTIVRVKPGGPAATAGLQVNDRLIEFCGQQISTKVNLLSAFAACAPGTPVHFVVVRGDKSEIVNVSFRVGAQITEEEFNSLTRVAGTTRTDLGPVTDFDRKVVQNLVIRDQTTVAWPSAPSSTSVPRPAQTSLNTSVSSDGVGSAIRSFQFPSTSP